MAEERVQRKLAAILAADVAGYSRLMGDDEAGTLAAVTSHISEVFEPEITAHHGRIFKTMGDAVFAEFASVVNAVRCAVAVQEGMQERNSEIAEQRRIDFRMAVNLGDVIVQDDDVFGDGVNVAARLEGLAVPGGVVVSGTVHEHVRTKLDFGFDDLGSQEVKNIAEPVRTYRVLMTPSAFEAPQPPPDKPSIAVLPFENMSDDPEQAYFSDGISEDIITDLSKISGLFVIARNSSFAYKGKAVNIQAVGRELGVRYLLEGSVRKSGGRVRVTAQLIEVANGGHLWAERFDRDLDDIFAVQDELTRKIVGALALRLTHSERAHLADHGTGNSEAYDLFLRGRELIWLHTRVEGQAGQELLRRAIGLDPDFGKAYALLAFVHAQEFINRWVNDLDATLAEGLALAETAVALAPWDSECHWALGVILLWQKDHDRALEAAQTCIELEPNSIFGYGHLGLVLIYVGEPAQALDAFHAVMRLDPHFPDLFLHFCAQAHFALRDFDQTVTLLRERVARNPNSEMTRVLLASAYGHLDRPEEARAEWGQAMRINPDYSLAHRRRALPFKNPADFDRMVEGLRKAGLAE